MARNNGPVIVITPEPTAKERKAIEAVVRLLASESGALQQPPSRWRAIARIESLRSSDQFLERKQLSPSRDGK